MTTVKGLRRVALLVAAAGLLISACSSATVASNSPAPAGSLTPPGLTSDTVLTDALKRVTASLEGKAGFTPPGQGPTAQQRGGTIAYIASDMTNGGITTVAKAVQEAAAAIGWRVTVFDGKATEQGRSDALNQAIATRPIGIVLGGFNATEQPFLIKQAVDLGIPVVGWHAASEPGPIPGMDVFTNVTTDPLQVAWLAAAFAVVDSQGKAEAVIFTDSQYQVAVHKAQAMQDYLKLCSGCQVLSYEDSPIATVDTRLPSLVSGLLQRHGNKLTYLLAINGKYYGAAKPALQNAGKPAAGPPKQIAAGDGDAAEFQRIRTGDYQTATIAEPLTLQGWQLVDELNRALAGQKPSGFVPSPGLITRQNVPSGNVFDPSSAYREIYRQVWSGQ
jgi:ribose transport system substrate-binding protein